MATSFAGICIPKNSFAACLTGFQKHRTGSEFTPYLHSNPHPRCSRSPKRIAEARIYIPSRVASTLFYLIVVSVFHWALALVREKTDSGYDDSFGGSRSRNVIRYRRYAHGTWLLMQERADARIVTSLSFGSNNEVAKSSTCSPNVRMSMPLLTTPFYRMHKRSLAPSCAMRCIGRAMVDVGPYSPMASASYKLGLVARHTIIHPSVFGTFGSRSC
ncbi:hypothetical protein ACEPAH_6652 [Sanghuangporus vaninii]